MFIKLFLYAKLPPVERQSGMLQEPMVSENDREGRKAGGQRRG